MDCLIWYKVVLLLRKRNHVTQTSPIDKSESWDVMGKGSGNDKVGDGKRNGL
jgi:hypothetical protein